MAKVVTVDKALKILSRAKVAVGGDACLILSLTGSEIEDADVNDLVVASDIGDRFVQVRVSHPAFTRSRINYVKRSHLHGVWGKSLASDAAHRASEEVERNSAVVFGEEERALLAQYIHKLMLGEAD